MADARPLRRRDLAATPMEQLAAWTTEPADAAALGLAVVSTTDDAGHPSSRVVPIRDRRDDAVAIHTDLGSAKGRSMIARPDAVSVLIFWPDQMRQLRLAGTASITSPEESARVFAARPRGAQLRAWSNRGAGEVAGRAALEAEAEQVAEHFAGRAVDPPPGWRLVWIEVREAEVFQASPTGIHDRFAYRLDGATWSVRRLAP